MIVVANERLALARKAAQLLYERGARHVWVFGSVAVGRQQDFRSDIDLAVEGLPEEGYFGALGELLCLLPCPVDLVEIERAPAALRASIERDRVFLPRDP